MAGFSITKYKGQIMKELTSFFNVLIKQSRVFLYAESPIILDFTCIHSFHVSASWLYKNN